MTEDTKRAVEIIKPIAKELGIRIDADEKRLYLNGQAIGISCNSTYATVMEALGYLFLREYPRFRMTSITKGLKDDIERYWVKK